MDRLEKLMQSIPSDLDGVLITSSVNRQYYTGLCSSAGILLATREQCYFLIDFRYIEVAKNTIKNCQVMLLEGDGREQLHRIVEKHQLKKIGIESSYLSVEDSLVYQQLLAPAELSLDNRVTEVITRQRMIKSADEVRAIQVCQDLTDDTFQHILSYIQPGQTEREIALEMEFYMRKQGAQEVSFSFIVVSGKNSSLPHGVPGYKKVEKGDFITMDFGGAIDGYRSDMTRTVALGEVSQQQKRLYDTVLKAQLAALDAIAVGKSCREIDLVARYIIYGAGYEGCFGHGLGHSVGLEIHESPRFSPSCDAICEPGLIMTVEPGIYLEGQYGCRIEDMVYITEKGIVNLTHSPKELICL